jgi:hypothetical protein
MIGGGLILGRIRAALLGNRARGRGASVPRDGIDPIRRRLT